MSDGISLHLHSIDTHKLACCQRGAANLLALLTSDLNCNLDTALSVALATVPFLGLAAAYFFTFLHVSHPKGVHIYNALFILCIKLNYAMIRCRKASYIILMGPMESSGASEFRVRIEYATELNLH